MVTLLRPTLTGVLPCAICTAVTDHCAMCSGCVPICVRVPRAQLKLPFPKSDATAAEKHIVDLSLFDEEELTTVKTSEVLALSAAVS